MPTTAYKRRDSVAVILLMIHSIETQLSAIPEDKSGPNSDPSAILSRTGINIKASNTAQPPEGFRFVADRSSEAKTLLEENGFFVKTEPVIALQVNREKGRLTQMTRSLMDAGICVDYVYPSLAGSRETKQLILKVANVPLASRVLTELSRDS